MAAAPIPMLFAALMESTVALRVLVATSVLGNAYFRKVVPSLYPAPAPMVVVVVHASLVSSNLLLNYQGK